MLTNEEKMFALIECEYLIEQDLLEQATNPAAFKAGITKAFSFSKSVATRLRKAKKVKDLLTKLEPIKYKSPKHFQMYKKLSMMTHA